jgi:hypothetical protein
MAAFQAALPLRLPATRAASTPAARRPRPSAAPARLAAQLEAGGGGGPPGPRSKIGLARALACGRVESSETVATLLLVAVNGMVKYEASERVDLEADVVTVRGKVVDCSGERLEGEDGKEDEGSLTRVQRDFRKGRLGEAGRAEKSKSYSRFVDGGFYSGKKWTGGM